jgi:hypothetical protein
VHIAMPEAREVRRHFGPKGKKMPDLSVFLPGILRRANQHEVWARLRAIVNVRKKHGLHFDGSCDCSLPPNIVRDAHCIPGERNCP